jgi:hypothetical protein
MAAYIMAAVKVTPPNDFPLGLIRSHMVVIHLFLMLCDLQRVVRDLRPILYLTCMKLKRRRRRSRNGEWQRSSNFITGRIERLPSWKFRGNGPGSSVGIATSYGLDGPGIESQWRRDFPHLSRPALGPTQPPVQWVQSLSRRQKAALTTF